LVSGRRLRVRLSIGALLVIAIVAITVHDAGPRTLNFGAIVAAGLGTVALAEYLRLSGLAGRALGRGTLVAGAIVLFSRTAAEIAGVEQPRGVFCAWFGLACTVPVLIAVLARRTRPVGPSDATEVSLAILGLLIVAFPALCLVEIGYLRPESGYSARFCAFFSAAPRAITEEGVGPWLLLVTILVSKLNDIGGYLVGSLVGRTPLAPGISPKKSIEGSLAGLTLGILASVVAFSWFCPTAGLLSTSKAVAFGVILSVSTQLGDLFESLIKRSSGVKDSAALIPAFGGILDLLDSYIIAAPAGYTLLWLWTAS
jgi:CDP-diglyceride synthetase